MLIEESQPRRILGYYTLSNSSIAPKDGPPRTQKVRRYAEVGALLLWRFALDNPHQGLELGPKSLLYTLAHMALGEQSGFQLLLVDPKARISSGVAVLRERLPTAARRPQGPRGGGLL